MNFSVNSTVTLLPFCVCMWCLSQQAGGGRGEEEKRGRGEEEKREEGYELPGGVASSAIVSAITVTGLYTSSSCFIASAMESIGVEGGGGLGVDED